MQLRQVMFLASVIFAGPACKDVTCGDGTIEKNGACAPASETVGTANCGPFTMLQGDKCVPMFDPTQCDPATTSPEVDPATGVTTCVGTGGGGSCTSPFACPAPAAGKQSICGQIYDLLTDQPFQAPGAMGAKCAAGATTGPCALGIKAFDAISFANNPGGATPLGVGMVYIDDCGRYRVQDIDPPSGPYVGLGFDDASAALVGPAGVTNGVGVATLKDVGNATKDFDGFVAAKSTTDMWTASGGPTLAQGMFVNIFRAHKTGHMEQAGVTFTRSGNPAPNDDFYFKSADTGRTMIDPTATSTGANGTAIVINAHISDGAVNSGTGGLPSQCIWETHPGSSIPNVVFVQVKRPRDNFMGDTCDL